MGKLQAWMQRNALNDAMVADKVGISRVHVCRIRNGMKTSVRTAKRLQTLTGIKWPYFLDPIPDKAARK